MEILKYKNKIENLNKKIKLKENEIVLNETSISEIKNRSGINDIGAGLLENELNETCDNELNLFVQNIEKINLKIDEFKKQISDIETKIEIKNDLILLKNEDLNKCIAEIEKYNQDILEYNRAIVLLEGKIRNLDAIDDLLNENS
ncbi:hypothetical protein DMUE_2986 [Dictyocoela muelleri]|nr:hypothetical protein DMUE_2986 [Dictyocoela muelleri]